MNQASYSQHKLSNGLRILYVPRTEVESVYVSLIGRVGRRAETNDEVGAAHFLEHLFFDGTAKRPSAFELNKFLEYYGGNSNGVTTPEHVEYWVKVLSKYSGVAFEFISDQVFNSLLKDEDIDKERKVIAQEASMRKDEPSDLLYRLRIALLYPNQKIGRTIFDEEKNLQSIDRQTLVGYMNRNYLSENFILTIAGNIVESEALKLAEQYFGQMKSGAEIIFEPAIIREEQAIEITHKNFSQSRMTIAFKSFAMDSPEANITAVLSYILGRGSTSRIYNRLRNDLHLVYSEGTSQSLFSDVGSFVIYTATDEEKIQKALDEIFSETKKLLNEGFSKEELEKAKNSVTTDFVFHEESFVSVAYYFARQWLLTGQIVSLEEDLVRIQSITANQVMSVAHQIFADKPKINLITKSLTNLEVNF